jgi:multidrug efflux pump
VICSIRRPRTRRRYDRHSIGVFPLVIASGAGTEMRRTLGTAVFSGMIGVTGFGIFLAPVFYYSIMRLADPGGAGPSAEKVTEKVQEATADAKKRAVEEPGQEITGGTSVIRADKM